MPGEEDRLGERALVEAYTRAIHLQGGQEGEEGEEAEGQQVEWKEGDKCMAVFSEDRHPYRARWEPRSLSSSPTLSLG
jgi:hypothetical protein